MWVLRVWRKVWVERGAEMRVTEGLIGRSNFENSSNKEARERGERPRRDKRGCLNNGEVRTVRTQHSSGREESRSRLRVSGNWESEPD
jgi:hypothetical protein